MRSYCRLKITHIRIQDNKKIYDIDFQLKVCILSKSKKNTDNDPIFMPVLQFSSFRYILHIIYSYFIVI